MVNVSAVVLIRSRNYQYLVGTETVISGVGDTFYGTALITISLSTV